MGLKHLKESVADKFENQILKTTILFKEFTDKEFEYILTYYYKDVYV